jgi:hypothetical protein
MLSKVKIKYMTINLEKIKEAMASTMLMMAMAWVIFALSFQVYFLFLHVTDNNEEISRITNELTIRIDGRFVDNPKNVFYNGK